MMFRSKEAQENRGFDSGFHEDDFKEFESLGEERVRSMLKGRELSEIKTNSAWEWLNRKTSRRTSISETRSNIALVLSLIAILVAVGNFIKPIFWK